VKPLAIDLFCGLGGWTDGLLAEGWDVIGFDIERHIYGEDRYPEYSYMAMPWTRAKAKAAAIRADESGAELERLNRLFNACFRIQREACEAAGRHIPMIVENVRGAIPWVGRSRWNFGSFHLWGDVPAIMPPTRHVKVGGMKWYHPDDPRHVPGQGFNTIADRQCRETDGRKVAGFRFDGSGGSFQTASVAEHVKVAALDGGRRTDPGKGARFTSRDCGLEGAGLKQGGNWWHDPESASRTSSSGSSARKAASAKIAKIPETLSRYIARVFMPDADQLWKAEAA
jgi:hypothetical protein